MTRFCFQAKFIVKTDQDVFVHIPRMMHVATDPKSHGVILGTYTHGIGCDVERTGRRIHLCIVVAVDVNVINVVAVVGNSSR